MKLSILDQSPVSAGKTAQEALQTTIRLAQLGDELGYHRFWVAEHHDLFGLACPNPSVMLGVIGSQTTSIRIGAGAVLLPYYKPFHVVETYHLLATLFPGRIDLGLGRAPGGSAEVSQALSDNYLKQVQNYEKSVDELMQFIQQSFPEDHAFSKITPGPLPTISPQVWMLGTSEKSAILAANNGMSYAFADFMTDYNGPAITEKYRSAFSMNGISKPYVIIAVQVVCAATDEEAEKIALSSIVWQLRQTTQTENTMIPSLEEINVDCFTPKELEKIESIKNKMIIGGPEKVKNLLFQVKNSYQADEIMIVTITHREEDKRNSYQLIKKEMAAL